MVTEARSPSLKANNLNHLPLIHESSTTLSLTQGTGIDLRAAVSRILQPVNGPVQLTPAGPLVGGEADPRSDADPDPVAGVGFVSAPVPDPDLRSGPDPGSPVTAPASHPVPTPDFSLAWSPSVPFRRAAAAPAPGQTESAVASRGAAAATTSRRRRPAPGRASGGRR